MPGFSFRSFRQGALTIFVLTCGVAAVLRPDVVLFPLGIAYLVFGVARTAWLGLLDRPDAEAIAMAQGDDITPLTHERHERLQEPSE